MNVNNIEPEKTCQMAAKVTMKCRVAFTDF